MPRIYPTSKRRRRTTTPFSAFSRTEAAMDESDRYQQGLRTRRKVLGDAHVDRALERRNEFTADFQDLITRYAWGEIWTRPGLDERTRRLLVLATMVALGREPEFKLHLRAAERQGVV